MLVKPKVKTPPKRIVEPVEVKVKTPPKLLQLEEPKVKPQPKPQETWEPRVKVYAPLVNVLLEQEG